MQSKNIGIRLKGYLGKGSSSTVYKIDWENSYNTPNNESVNKLVINFKYLMLNSPPLLKHIHSYGIYHRDVRPKTFIGH
ncbi:hypothetical protein RCL_jg25153.t1 [Rhizophagus clarus]|uniref:Protein kinase domain-containing protein n=1 Tax=Rhizophagus clarus TaxID=94130 RepID=A0A8H3QT36_9GLOM|nr:hypothetical protein RCL_jg25153.t1 [Rhizophagus clarus]